MEPKTIRFERVVGRRPVLAADEERALADEGRAIRDADEADGTNAFLDAAFSDALANEPDSSW